MGFLVTGAKASEDLGAWRMRPRLDVAAAADSTVYVADSDNHRIQLFDLFGTFLGTWGSRGDDDGQFLLPSSIAIHRSCAVYVADSNNNRIQVFRPVV